MWHNNNKKLEKLHLSPKYLQQRCENCLERWTNGFKWDSLMSCLLATWVELSASVFQQRSFLRCLNYTPATDWLSPILHHSPVFWTFRSISVSHYRGLMPFLFFLQPLEENQKCYYAFCFWSCKKYRPNASQNKDLFFLLLFFVQNHLHMKAEETIKPLLVWHSGLSCSIKTLTNYSAFLTSAYSALSRWICDSMGVFFFF